ncbi:MAG TPA: hypothetical protein EYN79_07430 [Planctomycetes bacterium]|nr:hypothetical protein [Planctomycetota bacterium]HIN80251.1 hypothetical protein [Planctomycetota bacterium]
MGFVSGSVSRALTFFSVFTLSMLLSAPETVWGQGDPDNSISAGNHAGAVGQSSTIFISGSLGLPTEGYSFGVEFDPSVLQASNLTLDGTAAESADFFAPAIDNGLGFFTLGVLMDFNPPIDMTVAPGDGVALVSVDFTVNPGIGLGTEVALVIPEFTGVVNPVETVVVQNSGIGYSPLRIDGSFSIVPNNVISAGDHEGGPGETVAISVGASLEYPTEGYSFGLEFDPGILSASNVTIDGTSAEGAGFVATDFDNLLGYMTVGVVIDLTPPLDSVIPAGSGLTLLNADLTVNNATPLGTVTDLVLPLYSGGSPPVQAVVVQNTATGYQPMRENGTFSVISSITMQMVAPDATAPAGSTLNHYIVANTEIDTGGYSFGIDFGESMLTLNSVDLDGTDAEAAQFFAHSIDNEVGGGWYTVGVVMDLTPPLDSALPAGTGITISHANFSVDPGASVGAVSAFEFDGNLTTPPINIVFSTTTGSSIPAQTFDGIFEVSEGAIFVRGDTDLGGTVDIGDAITTLNYLFIGGALFCLDAGDANDSGALDIGDGIWVLNYLFIQGPPPAQPFPDPGVDTTPDNLGCEMGL